MNSPNTNFCDWEKKSDPRSGRICYENRHTREIVWKKPLEITNGTELDCLEIERRKTLREFFNEMEQNVKNALLSDRTTALRKTSSGDEYIRGAEANMLLSGGGGGGERGSRCPAEALARSSQHGIVFDRRKGFILYRDGFYVHEWKQLNQNVTSSLDCAAFPLSIQVTRADIQRLLSCKCCSPSEAAASKTKLCKTGAVRSSQLKRCNSTGTLHITDTLSAPDRYSTILAVCFVINAHMFSSQRSMTADRLKINIPEYAVFNDRLSSPRNSRSGPSSPRAGAGAGAGGVAAGGEGSTQIPPLDEIAEFFIYLFNKTQLENDCMIIALLYIERVMAQTRGRLSVRMENWKSLIFACLVMASKVWDDLSMWNVDFSQVICGFDLARVNELETSLLFALNYDVRVSAATYAKYYFYLRSICSRFNLGKKKNSGPVIPLNFLQAKKLQIVTGNYDMSSHATHLLSRQTRRPSFNGFDHLAGDERDESPTSCPSANYSNAPESGQRVDSHRAAAGRCAGTTAIMQPQRQQQPEQPEQPEQQTGMRGLLPPGMSLPPNLCIEQIVSTQHTYSNGSTSSTAGITITLNKKDKLSHVTPVAASDYVHTPQGQSVAPDVSVTLSKAESEGRRGHHQEKMPVVLKCRSSDDATSPCRQRPHSWDDKRSSNV